MNLDRDIVIIGCGAGGGTAAQFARKTDRKTSITIFEKGKYPQYSRCGLPYVISGIIPEFDDLIEFSEEWFKKTNIDLLLNTKVEKIDVKNRIISAKKGNAKIEKSYGSLIFGTGAKPSIPPIENIKKNGYLLKDIFTVRTIEDARNISSCIKKETNTTIIGAGFIGLEIADNLYKRKIKVNVVETFPFILPNILDKDISDPIHKEISKKISVYTNHLATKTKIKNEKIQGVLIKNNDTGDENWLDTDLLIISTGVTPEVTLAKKIGCKIGSTGGIIVNSQSETSIKNIYAVGDCTEYLDFVTQKPILNGLGSIAVRQGITAGVNSAGGNFNLPKGFLQTCTSEFFGFEVAAVGPQAKYLDDISVISGKFNGYSRPNYFPNGRPINAKLFADVKTGKILAAQTVGNNAAQRINTFACAILAGMNIETLKKLETAYAPPIAPTLDVVTLVCDIVSKKIKHKRR